LKIRSLFVFTTIIFIVIPITEFFGQDTTSSLAFKNNKPERRRTFFYQPDLSYQIWQQFKLLQEAHTGDPLAMHELGLRYLLGDGFPADTIKGAKWIGKAADKKLTAAEYNYGILLNNGWGVDWDPFKAYKYFKEAAKAGMTQAEYIFGILNTNDLIANKNWDLAYLWINKAAKSGYDPAKDVLKQLKKKVSPALLDSTNTINKDSLDKSINSKSEGNESLATNLGLVFIDFNTESDSIPIITDKQVLETLWRNSNQNLADTLGLVEDSLELTKIKKSGLTYLEQCSEAGNPEALVLLGRLYEKGIYFKKDIFTASLFYIRATRFDSPIAPPLLWNIIQNKDYFKKLKQMVDINNPEAMYIWYGLYVLNFDHQFTDRDAIDLIQKAANLNYLPAMVELGTDFYTGKIVNKDKQRGIEIWRVAKNYGSLEAEIRLAAAQVFGGNKNDELSDEVKMLFEYEKYGSVLSQVALAYCYENGISILENKPDAVKYYRMAAQRGNRYAYSELKRMYDEIRPPNFDEN